MDFRSPFLKKTSGPHGRFGSHAASLPVRLLIPASLVVLILFPVLLISSRTLDPLGPGYGLYWIHDQLWLPFVGWTWTRFYPWSLAWWIPSIAALMIWLASYLSLFSVIRRPHAILARMAVSNKVFHPYLVRSERLMQHWGGPSKLLRETVDFCRRDCLIRLEAEDTRLLRRLTRYTLLAVELTEIAQPLEDDKTVRDSTIVSWSETWLQLHFRQLFSDDDEIKRQLALMADSFPRLEAFAETTEDEPEPGFHWTWLMHGLRVSTALIRRKTARDLYGPETAANERETRQQVINDLAPGITAQRRNLDEAMVAFQLSFRSHVSIRADQAPLFLGLPNDPTRLSAQGRIALDSALLLSVISGDVRFGLGYLEALEAVMLAVNLDTSGRPPRRRGDEKPVLENRLRAMFGALPQPRDYRICNQLLAREQQQEERLLRDSLLVSKGLHEGLLGADLPVSPSGDLLRIATGPEPDGGES